MHSHVRSVCHLALCGAFLLSPSAKGQISESSTYRITQVSVNGLQKWPEAEVVAESGLYPGEMITLQQIADAANKMARNGILQKVTYQYETQGTEIRIKFDVEEAQNLLPCRFDNFVWFTDAEIQREIHDKIPLFDGTAPQSGAMLTAIQDVLRGMLRERGVDGQVEFIPLALQNGPVTALEFRVTGISLPIRELRFPGASAISEDTLRKDSQQLLNQDYSADDVEAFVRLSLLTLYENRGYLRANFGEPQAQLRKTDNRVPDGVSVTLPVREGFAYVWNGVEWSGNRVLSTTDLNKFLDMRAGEIANAQKIDDGLRIVRDAYMSRGFIQMKLGTQKKLNDSVKFATYSLTIDEGSQFHMGTFSVTGLPGSLTKHLLKEWKIKPGEVFDQTYVTKFLKDKAAPAIYQSGSRGWNSSVKIQQDATAQTVNVQIAFNQ